jgi:hypothetical protein
MNAQTVHRAHVILIAALGLTLIFQQAGAAASRAAPDWIRDLVVYEIAPRAFTSPAGPQSGSFEALRARLPYLEELGITGIWLAGNAVSDPDHFFNVWSSYATIEPDRIDPALGTPQQFREMIAEAHRRGIKVFLDVTTHGLIASSPLVKRHPEWFRGGTWGMIDYDWDGGHLDLDEWWVRTWTDYIVRDGVDGFRIDVNLYRPDLWARIRQNAADAGHPIVIFDETNSALPGVTDFEEHDRKVAGQASDLVQKDVPAFFDRVFGRAGRYTVNVSYVDGTSAEGRSDGKDDALRVRLDGLTVDRVSRRLGDYAGIDPFVENETRILGSVPRSDGIPDVRLSVENLGEKSIQNIVVEDDLGQKWALKGSVPVVLVAPVGVGVRPLVLEKGGGRGLLYIATLAHGYRSFALSCHDYREYKARGSRSLFGYSMLFVPALPMFMSGEEFDASLRPMPNMSVKVFATSDSLRGQWLYGSMLDWNELNVPSKRAMFEDVKKMLAIRRQERAILDFGEAAVEPALQAVRYTSDITVPVPYLRWKGNAAIIVMGNRDTERDAHLTLNIPLERLGGSAISKYRVSDLWGGGRPRIYSSTRLAELAWTVRKDRSAGGGLGLLKIEVME